MPRPERMTVHGRLHWDDGAPPPSDVTIQLRDGDGTVIGTAKPGANGGYEMVVAAETAGSPVHLVVVGRGGQIVHSTRDVASPLRGAAARLDVAVPGRAAPHARLPELRSAVLELASEPDVVLDIARSLVDPGRTRSEKTQRILSLAPVERSLCGTPVLEAIEATIRAKGWPREVLHRIDEILAMREGAGEAGFAAATYDSANFRVTYQTSGTAAPPPSTASETVLDPGTSTSLAIIGDGATPTYILRVVFWLERALAAYISPPFGMRNPAAGGRIPVVINTSSYGSASPSGTFYLNNNLPADLVCAVGVHELFHMVQFQYGSTTGPWRSSLIEGGAVFAEDSAADRMNRYLDEAGSNFNGTGTQANPNLSLVSAGYKCCLFWRYVAEQQSADISEPFVGVETYRNVLEHCSAGSWSTADVKAALCELPWYQDFYEFSYLDPARLDLTNAETVLGNYALACYLKDLGADVPDRRFEFIEDEENIYIDEVVGGPASATLASPALAGTGTLGAGGPVAFAGSVNAFAHRYYEVTIDPAVTNVEVVFSAGSGLTSCLCQIALIDQDGKVRDIHRTDRTTYTKRVANVVAGKRLARVMVVVSGANTGGSFSLTINPATPAPNVMITRWHSVVGTEYEIDSRNWAWTWVSPDVWVDNDGDGAADGVVWFNQNNKLHVRLHNKGNLDAQGVQIEAFYQDAAPGLSPGAWKPVTDISGAPQVLSGLTLAAGATHDWVMDWAPKPSGTSQHFCVRVVVTAPGDPNTDNKRAVSNFGAVRLKLRQAKDLPLLLERLDRLPKIQVIPRLAGRRDLEISARDVRDLRHGEVEALSGFRIAHVPAAVRTAAPTRPTLARRERRLPELEKHHPTDPRTLPPGVAGKPMVTIAAVNNGVLLGGVTFMIEVEDR